MHKRFAHNVKIPMGNKQNLHINKKPAPTYKSARFEHNNLKIHKFEEHLQNKTQLRHKKNSKNNKITIW